MDLAALQEKINNYITVVSSWVRNVSALYFSGTPQNVTVDMIDDNGNLITSTLPNVAQFRKTVWDDVGGALGQLNVYRYVDDINGDDLNDGTSSSPFKTIKKACDSVPIAAIGHINIKGSTDINNPIVYTIENSILIENKHIIISRFGDTYSRIKSGVTANASLNYSQGFSLSDSQLDILTGGSYITLESTAKLDTTLGWSWSAAGLINCSGNTDKVFIGGYPRNGNAVVLRDGENNIIYGYLRDGKKSKLSISLYSIGLEVTTSSQTNKFITLYSSAGTIDFSTYGFVLSATDGNAITVADIFSGIVFDVNGVPRNITSNSVL